jgi:hypothetical protein
LDGGDSVEADFAREVVGIQLLELSQGLKVDASVADEVVESVGEESGCALSCARDAARV